MEKPFDLVQADAVQSLLDLPAGSVDLIVTDPAYESLEKHRAKGTTTRLKVSDGSSNEWFPIFHNDRFTEFFAACYHALPRHGHLYLYTDADTMFVVKPIAEFYGFKMWTPIVWDKVKIGMGYHYRSRYEFILFFEKGKRKLNDLGIPNVFDFKDGLEGYLMECARIRNGYPTEKPVKPSEILIRQSSEPGQLVCDPFMGSASVGEAALLNGRRFLGSDITEKAVGIARDRLERVMGRLDIKQMEMFRGA